MAGATIRKLTLNDLASHKRIIDGVGLFPSAMLDDMVEPYLSGASEEIWLTAEQGGVIGLAYAAPERMTDGTWNLLLIAVDPARHGDGAGTALMREAERLLTDNRVRVLLVETTGLPEFERTRRFYDYIGYEREAVIRDFYAQGEDKVVFRKALTA